VGVHRFFALSEVAWGAPVEGFAERSGANRETFGAAMFAKLAEAQGCASKLWKGYGEIPSPEGEGRVADAAKFRPEPSLHLGEMLGLRRLGYPWMGIEQQDKAEAGR
jgi:hypothetical protein